MFSLTFKKEQLAKWEGKFNNLPWLNIIFWLAFGAAVVGTTYAYFHGIIVAYGDSESHLNISKKVVDGLTPGAAQLGGIWLPIPHILMLPLVKIDFLWRSGLAGSIISGIGFVTAAVFIYKSIYFMTKNRLASFITFLVFITNPNMLYVQSTPLTEMLLIAFFVVSSYYFIRFMDVVLKNKFAANPKESDRHKEYLYLMMAALFAFLSSLTRYDGWFLVGIEMILIVLVYLPLKGYWQILKQYKWQGLKNIFANHFYLKSNNLFNRIQGMVVLFATLAFTGILLWLTWDYLILGDPLYFTNSQFSARAQQENWKAKGQLPAYHNFGLSFSYFFFDSMTNVGVIIWTVAVIGLIVYLWKAKNLFAWLLTFLLLVPFIFNVLTLYIGQSIIFIPMVTPPDFEWKIFNVRYGTLMLPAAAIFFGLLFSLAKNYGTRLLLFALIFLQIGLYVVGYSRVLALADGVEGLSSAKKPDAEYWLAANYDNGLILIDDYARSVSIIRSSMPMQKIIYVGNKPYWAESLKEPEKYARWIVMQKQDDVWNHLYADPAMQGRLYKYFQKVYTSVDIIIFKRNDTPVIAQGK